jgi:L-iditol 2-dehydrogenase
MKRAKIVSPGRIIIEDVEIPAIRRDEVLINVKYCGICGTDIHAYYGKHPFISLPVVPGHECSGVITDVIKETDKESFYIGQKVTIIPQITCGRCYNCRNGRYNICDNLKVIGCQTDGALAEYFSVRSDLVIPLPDELSLEEGALVEPLAVAIHAIKRGDLKIGDNVVILGAGTIGLLILQCAKAAGAKDIIITDIYDSRLELAKKLGADYTINSLKSNVINTILEKSGKNGIDITFECAGTEATINQAIQIARKGTRIVVIGVFEKDVSVKIGLVQDRELELVGSLMYMKEDFYGAINMMIKGMVKVQPLISRIYSIDEVASAFEFASTQKEKAVKVLIKPS